MDTYRIIRMYSRRSKTRIIRSGLTLEEAQRHCADRETSSSTATKREAIKHTEQYGPWFDGYESING